MSVPEVTTSGAPEAGVEVSRIRTAATFTVSRVATPGVTVASKVAQSSRTSPAGAGSPNREARSPGQARQARSFRGADNVGGRGGVLVAWPASPLSSTINGGPVSAPPRSRRR